MGVSSGIGCNQMMISLRSVASFIRWRVVALRYVSMLGCLKKSGFSSPPARDRRIEELQRRGFCEGPMMPPELIGQIRSIYAARAANVEPSSHGHPFINLFDGDDIASDNPVLQLAFSKEVLDAAIEYFRGDLLLDSVQVLYSWPTDGPPRESQKWHRDYNDSKSFHCIVYVNDVLEPEDGPFVFVDRQQSRHIRRSPIVRRIDDGQFERELGSNDVQVFYGSSGHSIFVDPAACYHYGSRCRRPRLALFITFSTRRPFVPPVSLVTAHAQALLRAAQVIRSDLTDEFLKSLLRLR